MHKSSQFGSVFIFLLFIVGGPVTHLFESLTSKKWYVHGVSRYCCYSIYMQEDGNNSWKPLAVNQVLEDSESSDNASIGAKSTSFTWA